MIKHNSPNIKKVYLKKLNYSLISNKLTTGEGIKKVENFFQKKYYKSGYSCMSSSGTAALFLAIKSLSKKKKLKILIPTYSCSALLNAIYLSGNIPVISDVNYQNFNIEIKKKYKAIDIIILVNIFGSDPNLKKIKKIYPKSKIILDSCHSIGKKIKNNDVSFLSDIVIHSFYATKIVTSGHGGLIWSKNKKYIDFCKNYINFDQRKKYTERFNFLVSDFQALLLYEQLKNLNKFRSFRKSIFKKYKSSLSKNVNIFSEFDLSKDIVYRAVLIFQSQKKRNSFLQYMRKKKIECIIPIMNYELLHNYLKKNKKGYKNSELISKLTLSIPMHHNLTDNNVSYICKTIKNFQ